MSKDPKKIPDEGTTAPNARPELRVGSGVFQAGPNSTLFDENAQDEALMRAVSDQVLGQAETDPVAARAASLPSPSSSSVDLGPSGTDATHLNLSGALDDTRPTPMVNRHELEAQLGRRGFRPEDPIDVAGGTVAGAFGSEEPLPRLAPRRIVEPAETTAPGALGPKEVPATRSEALVIPTDLTGPVSEEARAVPPKMAATLTFIPESPEDEPAAPRRARGVPKEESLLDRIGQPAPKRSSAAPPPPVPGRGLWSFVTQSPTHIAAGLFAAVALALLVAVVVVTVQRASAPAIMSRPLEKPAPAP